MPSLSQTSGIYTITNLLDGKMYVGCTKNFKERWRTHRRDLRANSHGNMHLQGAWNKYGEQNFTFEILVECDEKLKTSEEHYWCNILNVHDKMYGYNILPTHPDNKYKLNKESIVRMSNALKGRKQSKEQKEKATKGRILLIKERGYLHSEESKMKIAKAHTGRRHTEETILKLSKAKIGKKQSPEFIESRMLAMKKNAEKRGYRMSEETKKKIAVSHIGIKSTYQSQVKRIMTRNGNKIIQIYKDNVVVFECNLQKEAADFLGVSKFTVLNVLKGYQTKTRMGYILKYKEVQIG